LVGSLQTYEATLPHQKKGKSIALKYIKKEHDYSFNNDLNSEDIALVTRKFRNFMFKKRNNSKDKKKTPKILPKEMSYKIEVKVKI
jgi:hypothetical protein